MKHLRRTVAVATLVAAATVLPTSAHAADDVFAPPDRIELPNGWLPEGITNDGKSLYSGSRADGAIVKIVIGSGRKKTFAGAPGRVAVGIDHDVKRDVLWVAGGASKQLRAQDADTGEVLRTYTFPSVANRFVNDVTVTDTAVYATDSLNRELLVVPLSTRTTALPAAWRAKVLPLTGDLKLAPGNNLNGIVSSGGIVVAVQSNTGRLFRINPISGRTTKIVTRGKTFVNGDGLELAPGGTLYLVQNRANRIRVLHLTKKARSARIINTIDRGEFAAAVDVPSTVTLVKGSLFAVNARFGIANPETAPYWITRADAN